MHPHRTLVNTEEGLDVRSPKYCCPHKEAPSATGLTMAPGPQCTKHHAGSAGAQLPLDQSALKRADLGQRMASSNFNKGPRK